MTTTEFIERMAKKNHISKKQAKETVYMFTDLITESIAAGEVIKFRDCFTMGVKWQPPRKRHIPAQEDTDFIEKGHFRPYCEFGKNIKAYIYEQIYKSKMPPKNGEQTS